MQQNHLALTLSLLLAPILGYFVFIFLLFLFIYYFHCVWHLLLASFTALITFRYYFISLKLPWYHTVTLRLLSSFYLTLSHRHLSLSKLQRHYSMIETRRIKNIVIFLQIVSSYFLYVKKLGIIAPLWRQLWWGHKCESRFLAWSHINLEYVANFMLGTFKLHWFFHVLMISEKISLKIR